MFANYFGKITNISFGIPTMTRIRRLFLKVRQEKSSNNIKISNRNVISLIFHLSEIMLNRIQNGIHISRFV